MDKELKFQGYKNLQDDYYEFSFKKDESFTWEAGQYTHLTLPTRNVSGKQNRAFSMTSLPSDEEVVFCTRTGSEISSFKKELFSLEKGEVVSSDDAQGKFTLPDDNDEQPLIFVVGGVGITPIHALVEELIKREYSGEITLLYSSRDFYFFKDFFEKCETSLLNFKFIKVQHSNEVKEEASKLVDKYSNEGLYFMSGSPKFVEGMDSYIKDLGINEDRLKEDTLFGY
ncbi:oxidoreductase [Lactobacillus sp. S2-2]|uniref:FAD-dependent oxidoreductase n=1 Tax=Lactobacillus sp. S2-2 TaxID=2692917 RepID=UPI001F24B4BE|nr:FAD-dependent oxidoreductase [Lactobacillus sp. S2-2]MCF6515433.1 oxidoreductase [Lactobacillus sp. S2-2]